MKQKMVRMIGLLVVLLSILLVISCSTTQPALTTAQFPVD